MNTEVVNEIFKRRPARDFLRLYPSDKWKELIPDIFEIGVLNLKNSFGTLKFSKEQIKDILLDLRNYKPNEENININNNYIEEQNNNEDDNNKSEEEEEEYYNANEENNNINYFNDNNNNRMKNKEEIKERSANAEVFIPDENNIKIKVNYNRPKIAYNSTMEEIRERNIENKRNIGYTESKIKYQIMNDKRSHQMRKRKILNDDNNNDNERNFSFNKNKKERNTNKNYVINFDKKLNPQKPIEKQKNRYDYNYNNNFDDINYINNNSNNNEFNEENIFNNLNNNNYINNENNNNNQNVQNHLNNYKINMLNFPKFGFDQGNLNDN